MKHLLFAGLLAVIGMNCFESPTPNRSEFYLLHEYWPGDSFYPFPEGVYTKYKPRPGDSIHNFRADSLLHSLHDAGLEILEAWEIRLVRSFQWSPNFVLHLKDAHQPMDSLYFSPLDQPRLSYEANITHYIFR
jgi:hypothetical protein